MSAQSPHLTLVADEAAAETETCTGCQRRAHALAVMEIDLTNAEVALRSERRQKNMLQGQLDKLLAESDPHHDSADVVFDYWKKVCKPRAREFGRMRRVAVSARLKGMTTGPDAISEGEALVEIFRAIDGASHDAYVKDGKAFNDLELICRDPVTLKRFIDRQERWEHRTDTTIEALIWPDGTQLLEQAA